MYYIPLLILIISIITSVRLKKISKSLVYISMFLMTLIIIFRFGYGTDYLSYEYIFNSYNYSSLKEVILSGSDIEVGYRVLQFVAASIGLSFHWFIVLINLIMLYLWFKWIRENSVNKRLSLLMFYSFFFLVWILSAVRQGLVLSVGTYIFLSDKEFSQRTKFLSIIILFTIHKIALIYIVIFIINKLTFNKKIHLILLSLSIFFNILPLNVIFSNIPVIRDISYISEYVQASNIFAILSVSSMIRVGMFMLCFLFYDELCVKNRKLTDLFMVGVSIFILLSAVPLVASRVTIHTYVASIIVIPSAIMVLNSRFKKRSLIIFGFVIFNVLFFQKESLTTIRQSGNLTDNVIIRFHNIFNKDYSIFVGSTGTNAVLLNNSRLQTKVMNYLTRSETEFRKDTVYSEDDYYTIIYDPLVKNFIVINQLGDRLKGYEFKKYGQVIKDVALFYRETEGDIHTNLELVDLSNSGRSHLQMINAINHITESVIDFETDFKVQIVDIPKEELRYQLDGLLPNIRQGGTSFKSYSVSEPFNYNIVEVNYSGRIFYTIFDSENKLMIDILFDTPTFYSHDEKIKYKDEDFEIYFNKYGQINYATYNSK